MAHEGNLLSLELCWRPEEPPVKVAVLVAEGLTLVLVTLGPEGPIPAEERDNTTDDIDAAAAADEAASAAITESGNRVSERKRWNDQL